MNTTTTHTYTTVRAEARGVEDLDEVGAALVAFDQFGRAGVEQLAHIAGVVFELLFGIVFVFSMEKHDPKTHPFLPRRAPGRDP